MENDERDKLDSFFIAQLSIPKSIYETDVIFPPPSQIREFFSRCDLRPTVIGTDITYVIKSEFTWYCDVM